MKTTCIEVRRALEDGESSDQVPVHVENCNGCRAHAALLAALAAAAPGEADAAAVQAIMAARPVARWQRRQLRSWLPLAAGLALVGLGLVLLGGVPGSGAVAFLPGALGSVVALAFSAVADAIAVARGSAEALRALVQAGGGWAMVWLLLVALGGVWGVMALARRRVGARQG